MTAATDFKTPSDRELLEMAAKAAGRMVGDESQADPIGRKFCESLGLWCAGPWDGWFNPLNNDGDALRLAVKLRIGIETDYTDEFEEVCSYAAIPTGGVFKEPHDGDQMAATRRAIVRAAASIGKSTAPFPTVDEIRQFTGDDAAIGAAK